MITIITSTVGTGQLETYRKWVADEWGGEHSFGSPDGSPPLPSPLLALSECELVGGISFTWYPDPATSERALWINTLFVAPYWRGNGYGIDLIAAAEQHSKEVVGTRELFVYTDSPGVYRKRDWSTISQDESMAVLGKKI